MLLKILIGNTLVIPLLIFTTMNYQGIFFQFLFPPFGRVDSAGSAFLHLSSFSCRIWVSFILAGLCASPLSLLKLRLGWERHGTWWPNHILGERAIPGDHRPWGLRFDHQWRPSALQHWHSDGGRGCTRGEARGSNEGADQHHPGHWNVTQLWTTHSRFNFYSIVWFNLFNCWLFSLKDCFWGMLVKVVLWGDRKSVV